MASLVVGVSACQFYVSCPDNEKDDHGLVVLLGGREDYSSGYGHN